MKQWAKRILFRMGAARLLHRVRNRSVLTVLMFHRVLPPEDPRFAGANPAYTITCEEFETILDFVQRFYSAVSLDEVEAAANGARLPACPVLITFDDGWRDNLEYAVPLLRARGLPAVVFVATGHLGRVEGFWQEELMDRILVAGCGTAQERLREARARIAALERVDPNERSTRLAREAVGDRRLPARMMSLEDVHMCARENIVIGGHGHSHEPLTRVVDPGREFAACQAALSEVGSGGRSPPFSFPHGRYSGALVKMAKEAGFGLCFTSDKVLVPLESLGRAAAIGRVEIDLAGPRRLQPFDLAELVFSLISVPHCGPGRVG